MKKMNSVIYNKLLIQAEEAQFQGLTKLAEAIVESIGDEPADENQEYNLVDLSYDVRKDLWKIATKLMVFYNLQSADVEKIDKSLESWASIIIDDIEKTLEVSDQIKGPLETKLPGER